MTQGLITTSTIPTSLKPIVDSYFGAHAKHPDFYKKMFDVFTSDQAYEEDVMLSGSNMATIKDAGVPVNFDSISQGYKYRYNNVAYGIGYNVTREAIDDGKFVDILQKIMLFGDKSMQRTLETTAALVYDRAGTSGYNFGDGTTLIATDHPSKIGSQANRPTNFSDFNEAALEELVIITKTLKDDAGNQEAFMPTTLIGSTNLEFKFARVLKSVQQSGSANNDINALRELRTVPEYVCNPYLTDLDAFYVRNDCPDSMKFFQRVAREFLKNKDANFEAQVGAYMFYERYAYGCSNWRGIVGNLGA